MGSGSQGESAADTSTFRSRHWSAPSPLPAVGLPEVSCASSAFCAAVDLEDVFVYNRRSWSTPISVGGAELLSVSCVSRSFCVATGLSDAYVFNGVSWAGPVPIHESGNGILVSCVSPDFCVAAADGTLYRFNGTKWDHGTTVDPLAAHFVSVSCATTSFCVALDLSGATFVYDGRSWAASAVLSSEEGMYWVSCTASMCIAVGSGVRGGAAYEYRPARQQRKPPGKTGLLSVTGTASLAAYARTRVRIAPTPAERSGAAPTEKGWPRRAIHTDYARPAGVATEVTPAQDRS